MIKSIKVGNELAKYWGDRCEIKFGSGINVIYGPNGSGKTFLLDVLSHYTFISTKEYDKKRGWSSIINFGDTGFISNKYNFSMEEYLAKRGFGCEVDWDGVAVFRTDGLASNEYLNRKVSEIMCGCKNVSEISKNWVAKERKLV